ncbi:MAG: glycoside hydrolase family 2 TIM barrel-domain containing protein [Bacteroidota bacterium]|nr:glycoside hydrolase family 2 TIM barrel-domain containing protein [Bacteroidota bacterium]
MKYFNFLTINILFFTLITIGLSAQSNFKIEENFEKLYPKCEKIGNGICKIDKGILITRNAYACYGEQNWSNYEIKFSARTPATEKQVEIWAGFRAANRDDRYVIALKGGIQNDLYLDRLGYMGTDDFLALRHLDFKLLPGKFYNFRIQVNGSRIRIFLNHENLPRIDIVDKYSAIAPTGKITLGGCWIENDFKDLSINSLGENALSNVAQEEYAPVTVNKEKRRQDERAAYQPFKIGNIANGRTDISLNSKWLFAPGYEIKNDKDAYLPTENDSKWHVLSVPNFWNPDKIWLFGERYGTATKGTSDSYNQKEIERCTNYTFDYKKTSIGWYRQWIELPKTLEGKHVDLCFDAVSKIAQVWINGQEAGGNIGMFGAFKIDATGLLKPGKNLVAVKVYRDYVNEIENADKIVGVAFSEEVTQKMLKDLPHGFYGDDPAGIWQPVSLVITNPLKIENVLIKPGLTGAAFNVTIKNYSNLVQDFSLITDIVPSSSKIPLYKETSLKSIRLNPGEQRELAFQINGLKPKLWSPATPNLYNFNFILQAKDGNNELDRKVICSGFKTFEVKGDYFYLNGKPYWLRGANQTAMPLEPNDSALADRFCKLMHDGNIAVTRTHTAPYSEVWMKASDKNGVGISFEGTWPWLMIGDSPIPDAKLLQIWKDEFLGLIQKYRNHPSLMMWTINNEMNFYYSDPDIERAKKKMEIISDVVKQIRMIDPTHPICFASNYSRKEVQKRFGEEFMKNIDDGDMDDIHKYPNWYNESIFAEFTGEFQEKSKFPGRPLISQEMSTGYPDETGHPTRFYAYVHQTPASLVGKYAYAYNDPKYFLQTQSFITKELAEALRRSNEQAAGILHFSLATWFKDLYLPKSITPFSTYYGMKKALAPVLVSAELWGRHFYAGEQLPGRICIVNDKEDGCDLSNTSLEWQLLGQNNKIIASGKEDIPQIKFAERKWVNLQIAVPGNLSPKKAYGKLMLKFSEKGQPISENEYDLLFATREWAGNNPALANKKIAVLDNSKEITPVLDFLNIKHSAFSSVKELLDQKADVYIMTGLDSSKLSTEEANKIKSVVNQGGKVLLLNSGELASTLYPRYIRGFIDANPEIVMMDIPESPVFSDIEPLETRYFNNNKSEIPTVCRGAYQINRNTGIEGLASSVKVHGYLQGDIYARSSALDKIKGFPIVKIMENKGIIILSEMELNKGTQDPVAGRLLSNLLVSLIK